MKWIIFIIAGIVALVAIVYLIGSMLPIKHSAVVARNFKKSPGELWSMITNSKDLTTWRRNLKKVDVIDDRNWKETSEGGDEIVFQSITWEPEKKWVTKIMNDLPFGGQWVYELEPSAEGTLLTITENGEVYNPLFRFMSKYIFGHETTLKNYFEDLEKLTNGSR